MSKLLKIKFLLGVAVFVLAAVVTTSVMAADGAVTKTLRYGMKDIQVKYLQQTLNDKGYSVDGVGAGSVGKETTFFGNATKTAVKAFQAAMGLTADGIFGPASRGALGGSVSGNFPAGCTSASGYSSTTGQACYAIPSTPSGLPTGCTSTSGYSPTTGAKCDSSAPVVNPSGPVSVMLASDNPASRSVVTCPQAVAGTCDANTSAEAGADFAHFLFSGTGTVTNVTLKRIGISADASLASVYLYDGAKRLTDAASVSSGGMITFNDPNGLFVVNGAKVISIKVDMLGSSGETLGVSLVGFTALGQTAVTLATPLSGNLMSVASATLAAVTFGVVTPAANGALTPATDITVWQSQAAVTTRDVSLSHFTIREVGGVAKTDLQNLRLYIDGVVIGTVANPDANGYSTFVPASPLVLKTGSHMFKVVADVIGGSSLSFTFSIRSKTDIGLVDSQYGVGFLATDTVADLTGFLQTVATGYITVEKATDSPSSTVVLAGTDVLLAKFKATTYGERVKVDGLTVDYTTSGTVNTLRNGRVLVNGVQVGSTTNINPLADTTATDKGTLFNINYTFDPGVSYIEVRGDIYAATGTAFVAGDTIKVNLYGIDTLNNAQGLSSGTATLDVPGADVAGNTLTVGSGSIVLSKDQAYGDQSVVVPTTATLLGSWALTSGTNEALNLDTITVDFLFTDEFAPADLTNVYVMYGSKLTSTKATVVATDGTHSTGNSWSISESMPVNTTMVFKVYGNIATGAVVTTAGADNITGSLKVSGTSASGTAVNTNGDAVLAGQTITAVNSGTLTVSLDSSTPVATQVVAGTTDVAGALKLKLTATNEDTYVKSVKIYVDTNDNSKAVSSMNLSYATTTNGTYTTVGTDQSVSYDVSTYPGYSVWTLTGSGRVVVPKNGSVFLKVTPTYVSSGQTLVSGKTPKLFLGDLQAEGTSVLVAGGAATLINSTGIVVKANTSATYATSTETIDTAIALATTRTISMTGAEAFVAGDVIFIDTYAADCATHTPDGLWSGTCEELMVVLDNGISAANDLTVQRGAFGTTAQAVYDTGDTIYSLGGVVANTNGVVGNAMTVLNTKLGVALKSDSPSGATNGASAMYVFGFTVSAANNAADTAANTATLTYVDITASKSSNASANVANMILYPAESGFDQNATYLTTCVGLSPTKWRCTLITVGSTNQIDENTSREYKVYADVGFTANGNVKFSLASLGSSSTAANLTTGNSVAWSDGASTPTAQYWVSQGTSIINGGQLSSILASGTTEAVVPTVTGLAIANGSPSTALVMGPGDTILITFSEMIDPSIINTSLIPGVSAALSTATDIANTATGGLACTSNGTTLATCTIAGILTFTDTYGGGTYVALTPTTDTLSLNAAGTQLTVTIKTATGGTGGTTSQTLAAVTAIAGTATVGIRDIQGNLLAVGATGVTATGSF